MKADVLMAITGERSVGIPIEDAHASRRLGWAPTSKGSRSVRAPEWTHAECAQANGGVERRYWLAQMYVYRMDDHVQLEIVRELLRWAVFRRTIQHWPDTYRTQDGDSRQFLVELVHMALVEVREPWRFACGSNEINPRRVQMRCSDYIWRRRLSPIYETIMSEILSWVSIGVAQANVKLSEEY